MHGRPLDEPIPVIRFESMPHPDVKKNLVECITCMTRRGHDSRTAWRAFIDWLLWGFGAHLAGAFPVEVTEEISWDWYRTFDMSLMLVHPTDYMAWGSCELANMSYSGNPTGYFPTPMNVSIMMARMLMTGADTRSQINDPCLGTGSMLLEASNYSLRLSGQDINHDMVKMATVNAWLYIPWLAYNADDRIDWHTKKDYEQALQACRDWETAQENGTLLIPHREKEHSLRDWV